MTASEAPTTHTTKTGVTIRIITGVNCYTVDTWQGPNRLDGWSRTYATHAEARAAANHTWKIFQTYRSDVEVDRRRQELHIANETRTNRLIRQGRHLAHLRLDRELSAIADELEGLATLHDRANIDELRQAMAVPAPAERPAYRMPEPSAEEIAFSRNPLSGGVSDKTRANAARIWARLG